MSHMVNQQTKTVNITSESIVFLLDTSLYIEKADDTRIDLLSSLSSLESKALTFDAFYDESSKSIRLGVLVRSTKPTNMSSVIDRHLVFLELYITDSFNPNSFDWNSFKTNPGLWKGLPDCPVFLKEAKINLNSQGIAMAVNIPVISDRGLSGSMISSHPESVYYYLSFSNPNWQKYSLPQTSYDIQDIELVGGDDGVVVTYWTGDTKSMLLQRFTNPSDSKLPPLQINKIIHLADQNRNKTLYVSYDQGVFSIPDLGPISTVLQSGSGYSIYDFDVISKLQCNALCALEREKSVSTITGDSKKFGNGTILSYRNNVFYNVNWNLVLSNSSAGDTAQPPVTTITQSKEEILDQEYRLFNLPDGKLLLSVSDEPTSIGFGTDLGAQFAQDKIIIFAEAVIVSEKLITKTISISAFNMAFTGSQDSGIIVENGDGILHLQTDLNFTFQNTEIIKLFDYNDKKYLSIKANSRTTNTIEINQTVRTDQTKGPDGKSITGFKNIDLTSFMFAHPVQCQMLLQKALLLYSQADPVFNLKAFESAMILLNRIEDRLATFLDPKSSQGKNAKLSLTDYSNLVAFYQSNEASIGTIDSISILQNVYYTAATSLSKLKLYLDYQGNKYNFVPLSSYSFFFNQLEAALINFKNIEDDFVNFLRAEQTEEAQKIALTNQIKSFNKAIDNSNTEITHLADQISDTEKQINDLQSQFNAINKELSDEIDKFTAPGEGSSAGLPVWVRPLVGTITGLAFVGMAIPPLTPFATLAAGIGSVVGGALDIAQAIQTTKGTSGVNINSDYLVTKVSLLAADLKDPQTVTNEITKLQDGEIEIADPKATKLLVDEKEFEVFINNLTGPHGGLDAIKDTFKKYVDVVIKRNNSILSYNAEIVLLAQKLNIIQDANNQINVLSEQNIEHYNPNLPVFVSSMKKGYLNAQSELMFFFYQAERALQFLGPTDKKPVLEAIRDIPNISSSTFESAILNIQKEYDAIHENFAQKELATFDNLTWDISDDELQSLKEADIYGNYSTIISLDYENLKKAHHPLTTHNNVRLTKVYVWLKGFVTQNDQIKIDIQHMGKETITDLNGYSFIFEHETRNAVQFEYSVVQGENKTEKGGQIASADDQGHISNEYSFVGPFADWQISINLYDNPGLDLQGVSHVSMEFAGSWY